MADAPAESQSTGSQIHPLLRQRMLNRAATFTEGAHHSAPSLSRRRSSMLSEYSDTRHSFRSSTDSLLRPGGNTDMDKLATPDEPSLWHSAPLVFAIVPAFAGLLFQNGGAIVTDILLLGLASMFLNWCVRAPWDWYHAAQQVQYLEPDEPIRSDTILEEDEESDGTRDNDGDSASAPEPTSPEEPKRTGKDDTKPATAAQDEARQELRANEILALLACFAGPMIGAYLLHAIRSQLTRPAEGLVSNVNLTIFVMGAELRPVSHLIKMKEAHMLHLQRIARPDAKDEFRNGDVQELSNRLAQLEARVAEPVQNVDIETLKISAMVRQGIQPQLDALNRAVRRYEKRQAAQTMQTEARFQDLDSRLKDALSLAAAAARSGQRPGLVSIALTWVASFTTYWLQTAWAVATYPLRTVSAMASQVQGWFVRTDRQPRKRVKGQVNGHSSVPAPRVQSRGGR
ncbi:hypothetical protein BU26DRAFT_420411 [Trematosphaeria pertusa]|uniref:Uncharacterized protein n=1 Tax=Trematosphaeria pertusa TaxID=390896 RepID=A0A6A6IWQ1_9PLEO|nr:uncharacterized protein BU26DRAFT_420411 [Trematosphaeria pertusa]KAF2254050.1 hypothetical protein BU26DRAFT_420411 [Trematosphaeria pertusa]